MRVREGRDQALQKAIRKYGADAFKVQTLVIADNWEYLCDLERKAIDAFGTRSPGGYNLTVGGEGVLGRIHTPEAAANMSAGQKKRVRTEEEKARAVVGLQAYWNSPAGLAKKAAAKARQDAKKAERKRTWADRHSKAVREALARPEVRAKVMACAAKRAADPEWRKNLSASLQGNGLGSKRTDETRAKMAEARRQWWARKHASKLHED